MFVGLDCLYTTLRKLKLPLCLKISIKNVLRPSSVQSLALSTFPPGGRLNYPSYLKASTIPRFKSEQYKKCEYGRRELTNGK